MKNKFQITISTWIYFFLLIAFSLVSCTRSEKQDGSFQNGETPAPVDFAQLIVECQNLAEEGEESGVDYWGSQDELPSAVASLSPQFVRLSVSDKATVIDIQTSGGFVHAGYLVVCSRTDPDFVPVTGRDWEITEVFPEVFEYRE